MINSFKGDYDFLSNFYACPIPISYNGLTYLNSEAVFQAQKTLDPNERINFTHMAPNIAKAAGKKVKLRSDWEEIKVDEMYKIVKAKFTQNPSLKIKLLNTGDEYLEEGNYWQDRFWGVCKGVGENNLGKILMKVREEIRNEEN